MSFDDKRLSFGGAPKGSPWGTLGEIAGAALAAHGYSVAVNGDVSQDRNPRAVSDGTVDFGATRTLAIRWAYEAQHTFAKEEPRRNLRLIASIAHPSWLGIGVRWESGITDLTQIKERRLPVRVIGGGGPMCDRVWAHYGLSRQDIESWGGVFHRLPRRAPGHPFVPGPWVRAGEFDLIMDWIYSGQAIEMWAWQEASILFNLRYLPLPAELVETICRETGAEPATLPHHLYRGVNDDLPTIGRTTHSYYGRDDMPEPFVYLLASALDEQRQLFRERHLAYSYEPRLAAGDFGVPLHPGAERYYREVGYL